MPRIAADTPLTTRSARERLAPRKEPYWRGIEAGLALGYRRGAAGGGTWLARILDAGRYREERLGRTDDTLPSNGADVLDFRQAQTKAVAWAARVRRIAAGLEAHPGAAPSKPYTVEQAMADYLSDMKGRGARSLGTTTTASNAHIMPTLGAVPVTRLTRDKVRTWHRALATAPVRRRGKAEAPDPADADAPRRRQASANRILTILKAALNHARVEGRYVGPDDAWKLAKPFRGADAPKVRYLSDHECVRLANACPPDFRALVTGALLTGCRYGELAAMRAADLDHQAGSVNIPRSKSGKPRHVVLSDEGRAFFARMTHGKPGDAPLFERDATDQQATRTAPAVMRRARWGASDQFRAMANACEAASIVPGISFHVLRHTYASRLAARAVPMPVIAQQLGHADTRMTERHYAHLAPSYVADTVRAAFTSLGIGGNDSNVAELHPRQAAE